jgi:hypothetical protein
MGAPIQRLLRPLALLRVPFRAFCIIGLGPFSISAIRSYLIAPGRTYCFVLVLCSISDLFKFENPFKLEIVQISKSVQIQISVQF